MGICKTFFWGWKKYSKEESRLTLLGKILNSIGINFGAEIELPDSKEQISMAQRFRRIIKPLRNSVLFFQTNGLFIHQK